MYTRILPLVVLLLAVCGLIALGYQQGFSLFHNPPSTITTTSDEIPDIAAIKRRTQREAENALLNAKESFYHRCINKISWTAKEGQNRTVVWYDFGTKEDHKETIDKLIKAGYKVDADWSVLGVIISWE